MRYEIRKINKEKEARWAAPPHFGPLPVPRLQPSLLHLAPTRGPRPSAAPRAHANGARGTDRWAPKVGLSRHYEPGAPTDGPLLEVVSDRWPPLVGLILKL